MGRREGRAAEGDWCLQCASQMRNECCLERLSTVCPNWGFGSNAEELLLFVEAPASEAALLWPRRWLAVCET